jgi:hypothetical protein
MAPALDLLAPATNTAFVIVFGVFVVAMVVLVVIIITWAVRHDIAGRRSWRERQEEAIQAGQQPPPVRPNRLALRAYERAQQRAQPPRRPPGSSS